MKKTILLLVILLCVFNSFSQTTIIPETLEKSFSRKKSRTIRAAKNETIKSLNILVAETFDSDGDGVPDDIDIDSDNDGIADVDEEFYCRKSLFAIVGIPCDTDNDGVPDIFDLDSDNDGIPDVVEAGFGYLSEGRGTLTGCATWVDVNGNGMHDLTEGIIPFDTDGDGVPNYLDLDSDNDSLFDVDESGAGNSNALPGYVNGDGDINGDGVGDGPESETFGDGILDIFDYGIGANQYGNLGQGLTGIGWKDYVKDSDNDGIPDYMDTKSNGTTFDIAGTLYAHLDANNDGLIDGTIDIDRDGILDAFDTNTTVFGSPRDLNRKLHLYFDGRNDYIEELDVDIINGQSEVTLMAWIKFDTELLNDGVIVGQNKFYMQLNKSKWFKATLNNWPLTAELSPKLTLGKWTHLAAVYDKFNTVETLKLYINGEKVATRNSNIQGGIETSTNQNFRIGRTPVNTTTGSKDMFKGEIDEVRVFNKALTDDELQKMVYQELDELNGFNSGTVIPRDISPNIGANLVRYFRMDVFKNDIVDNLTTPAIDEITGAKMYNIKNIYSQTAPLPYETKADVDGDWSDEASWLHGAVWDIDSEATNKHWAIVQVKNNLSTSKSHTLAGLIVDKDKKLAIKESQELKNTWYLELDGVIDLEDESQLVQTENSMLDQDSGGYIERDQQGTANSFNYNYWSSSVGTTTPSGVNQRGSGVASVNSSQKLVAVLFDGTGADGTGGALPYPKEINFQPKYWAADAGITTPIIISSYWLHTFNGTDNNYGSWKPINENTLLLAGEGYTMKGTSGAVNIGNQQNYVFKGKPNNGNFTLQIDAGNSRLIGNPYPSAMDADEFIKDNIKETINSKAGRNKEGNIFNGALYFWDHFGQQNSHYLKDYVGGYATYTLMGGAIAYSNDGRINNNGSHGNKKPGQYIPVGQGFFVIAALELNPSATYTTTTINGGKIVFKNSQRIFKTEAKDDSVFMKGEDEKSANSSVKKAKDTRENIDKRPKIWLQYDSPTGYSRQLLVGVDENATNHFDLGFDAPIADIGKEDMFWIFDGGKFVIQAVNNFSTDQELPLGVIISKTGLARIKIEEQINMDENISAHIKDKLTGGTHNISRKPFEINLEAGNYFDRFSLIFKMHKLVDEDVNAEIFLVAEAQPVIEGIYIFMDNAIGELLIKNNSAEEITGIILYNYLGQNIKSWNTNLNRRTISLPINMASGIYFVQIRTKNKMDIKKIVIP
ncbi:MAG: T9SS type A sorting domain-containing protein [Lutibacter sp.]|nr:T9SS type A sorting domain-containing protein [Lutibacter sp.]